MSGRLPPEEEQAELTHYVFYYSARLPTLSSMLAGDAVFGGHPYRSTALPMDRYFS